MAFDETLAERIRQHLVGRRNIVEKKKFVGIAFLLNGNILVGVWKDSLIARLGSEQSESALRDAQVSEFDITGKAMNGWVLIAPAGIAGDQLHDWVEQALNFVTTLPAK